MANRRQRNNPNAPMSNAGQARQDLQDAANPVQEVLPDDVDALKSIVAQQNQNAKSADAEIASLRAEIEELRPVANRVKKVESQLNQELKITESQWRPLDGYQTDEYGGIDAIAAPMGKSKTAEVAVLMLADGKPIGLVQLSKARLHDDGKNRYMLK